MAVLISCSTKKNTFTRRVYHNLTAHYNAFWNGRESFRQGVMELQNKLHDNYNEILAVYKYGTKTEAQSVNPAMDKAIEKASMVIQQHSMEFGGKEYVRWIDDCYMLIGKSYFYKHEYVSARRSFNFVANEYPDNDIKYVALLWLAKTYNQMGQFEKSEPLLKSLQEKVGEERFPYKVEKELPLVLANAYILQEKYESAIDPLIRGIELNNKRDLVTRLKFILAQIYQKNDNLTEATDLYLNVIKRNPSYEMAFQAKINLAKSYDSQSGDREKIIKTLTKMLKDVKNEEYKDQIYYALAEIALKDQQDSLAQSYLSLSVANSTNNNYQKTISSLKLADIYFEGNKYKLAGAYYDTAMQAIPGDFPNIEELKNRAEILSSLVDNLVVIQTEDSLQRLAQMPESQRLKIIDGIIEKLVEEEQKKAEEELLKRQNRMYDQDAGFNDFASEGGWYFYNNSAKSQGYTEFIQKWGDRKLEDLWRLSNKRTMSFGSNEKEMMAADSISVDSTLAKVQDPMKRSYYLQNIPLTEEDILASNNKIKEAYFNLGKLYKEGLEDLPKSKEAFLTLIARFPENKYLLETYYNLYKLYENDGDTENMELYKNLILSNFPDSDFAKVIENPNYFEELASRQNEAEKLYARTYKAFKERQYFLVINYADNAIESYQDTSLLPRFEYLRALSLGKVEVVDTLLLALTHIIRTYPKSEITPMARNIMQKYKGEGEDTGETDIPAGKPDIPFKYTPNESHFFVVVANRDSVNTSALKVRLSDFDRKYFSLRKLKINSFLYDNKQQLVTVNAFENKEDAMNYYNVIAENEYVFANLNPKSYYFFVISNTNYPILIKQKNLSTYLKYFENKYLK